ncbi:MAG: molybdate ABC transporter substrate-binding protein [Planctomycetota bacterium]
MRIRNPQSAIRNVGGARLVALISLVVLALLVLLLRWQSTPQGSTPSAQPLLVYCAAGLKVPVEVVARAYKAAYGTEVQLQFGGSQTLLAGAAVSHRGDVYIPADEAYVQDARSKGLVEEVLQLARMQPVLAVKKGNPKNVKALDDLLRTDVRVCQADPDAAAVGRLVREALQKSGRWEPLKEHTTVSKPTVNDVANDIKIGAVDAGFVWDATIKQYAELEIVAAPELNGLAAHVSACILRASANPAAALRFARYLSARDKGLPEFQRYGFTPVEGDPWAETPEIRLFAGAMLRPGIDQTIADFEQREGAKVTRVYHGCGVLVGMMKTGQHPDAYFSCDKSFMAQVTDLYLDPTDVSENQLVILTPKGNPKHLNTLKDLCAPGLKIGLGNEKQSALGALTKKLLDAQGLSEALAKNVAAEFPAGDMLVNVLLTGSLDACVVYVTNAAASRDKLEMIPVDLPGAKNIQPFAIGKECRYPCLTARLWEKFKSLESKQRFEANGFKWLLAPEQK